METFINITLSCPIITCGYIPKTQQWQLRQPALTESLFLWHSLFSPHRLLLSSQSKRQKYQVLLSSVLQKEAGLGGSEGTAFWLPIRRSWARWGLAGASAPRRRPRLPEQSARCLLPSPAGRAGAGCARTSFSPSCDVGSSLCDLQTVSQVHSLRLVPRRLCCVLAKWASD